MVDTIRPPNTWSRVTSPTPVKKIDRRRDRQDEEKFQEHLAKKNASADQDETDRPDGETQEAAGKKDAEKTDSGAAKKSGKRIDIII